MYFSDETQKEYNLLKKQREVLVAWDKFRTKLEENQTAELKAIDDEEDALIAELDSYVEENKPRLKRPSIKTYTKKNICIILSLAAYFIGYFLFAEKNVYIYHGISLAGSIVFMIIAMIVYRLDLIKEKDKGRIYKPIIDYLFILIISVPAFYLIGRFAKISNAQFLPILVIIPLLFDILYVAYGIHSWNKKMDKCRLHEKENNEKIKDLEEKKENLTLENKLEYDNKYRDYFKEEADDIYLPYFSNGNDVEKLISYFDQGRAETIKEAITIFFEEKRYDELNKQLGLIMKKVDDMAITEQEVHTEMKNMRLATINQLGGVQEAIVGTIKHDRMAKMTATQKKAYEKKLAKAAVQEEKKENKKALKEQKRALKETELEEKRQEQIAREAEREAVLLAKREEKLQKELEKKKEKNPDDKIDDNE